MLTLAPLHHCQRNNRGPYIGLPRQHLTTSISGASERPGSEQKYPKNTRVNGLVTNIMPYGAFVKLAEGIEGLVHISEMSWTKRINHPSEMVQIGDKVEVVILDVNPQKQEISLGMKQIEVNPWSLVEGKYPPGKEVSGTVRNLTNYGAFVELEEGVEGLIHVSQLSSEKVTHPEKVVKVGDEIKAKVIKVDTISKKIGLSIKAYTENLDPSQIDLEEVQLDIPAEDEEASESEA
ncbi:MAG: S1 RNA-binding domain-containing protein [Nitrospinae bacterium]|nr:S1 RNA-binding domain-containing protein [Nitrospinota bacterium]